MGNNPGEKAEEKFQRTKLYVELGKWFVGGVVVIIGFLMIRPHEQERQDRALQLEINKIYIQDTDFNDTDEWQRKLNLLDALINEDDRKMRDFINEEKENIKVARTAKDEGAISIARMEPITQQYNSNIAKLDTLPDNNQNDPDVLEKRKKLEDENRKLLDELNKLNEKVKSAKQKLEGQGLSTTTVADKPDFVKNPSQYIYGRIKDGKLAIRLIDFSAVNCGDKSDSSKVYFEVETSHDYELSKKWPRRNSPIDIHGKSELNKLSSVELTIFNVSSDSWPIKVVISAFDRERFGKDELIGRFKIQWYKSDPADIPRLVSDAIRLKGEVLVDNSRLTIELPQA